MMDLITIIKFLRSEFKIRPSGCSITHEEINRKRWETAKQIINYIEQQEKELWKYKEVERVRNIVENDFSLPDWEVIQEQQEKYAKLGRLAVEGADECHCEFERNVKTGECDNCCFESFCQLRDKLLTEDVSKNA